MHIVFCGDNNIVKPVGVASASIVQNCPGQKIKISIVGIGWSNEEINSVKNFAGGMEINYIAADDLELPQIRKGRHLTAATYLILYLPQIFKYDTKILYLDYDVMVRDSRIIDLWNTELKAFPIAAVQAVGRSYVGSRNGIPEWRRLNLDPKAPMFNSGVVLFNLEKCREIDLTKLAFEYAKAEGHNTKWADQQALNVAINGNWKSVSPIFNAATKVLTDESGAFSLWDKNEVDDAMNNPCIVHFLSKRKPWIFGENKPFFDEWRSISSGFGWTPWLTAPKVKNRKIKKLKKQLKQLAKRVYRS